MKAKIIQLIMLFPLLCPAQSQEEFFGTWQSSSVFASGWDDRYLFFEDGTFKFFFSHLCN